MESILAAGGIGLYGLASIMALFSWFRPRASGERLVLGLMTAGALPLLAVLSLRLYQEGHIPAFSRFEGLAWYAVAISFAYLLMTTRRARRGIAGLLAPFVTVVLLCGLSARTGPSGPPPRIQSGWLAVHIVTAYAAYAVFTLASLLALAYLVQDHNLKHKRFGAVWESLPPLETLDHLMSRQVGLAFLLFTVSIVLGFIVVRRSGGGQEWLLDPKVEATIATWILFAVLVHMRASAHRHGTGVAILTVFGLLCVLFAFLGVHLVSNSVHAYLQVGALPY